MLWILRFNVVFLVVLMFIILACNKNEPLPSFGKTTHFKTRGVREGNARIKEQCAGLRQHFLVISAQKE